MSEIFEEKLRWPGAPQVCLYENLFAFKDEKAIGKFQEKFHPGVSVVEKWKCAKCDCWHYSADDISEPQFRKDCKHKKYTNTHNPEKRQTERRCNACGKTKIIPDPPKEYERY